MANDILWKRNISATFGVPGKPGVSISGLNITFKIKKDLKSKPNKGKIKIYNMSRLHRDMAEQADLDFILYSSYGDQVKKGIIHRGDVFSAFSYEEGENMITEFEVHDGMKKLGQTIITKTYKSGTKADDIIKDITKKAGVTLGALRATATKVATNYGYTKVGKTIDQIADVVSDMLGDDVDVSMQNDELIILPPDLTTGQTAVVVGPQTGMIGSIKKTPKYLTVRNIIIPELQPGRAIKLQGTRYDGFRKIVSETLTGGQYEDDFSVTMQTIAVKSDK